MTIKSDKHLTITNHLSKIFQVEPFDLQAAAHFARIWNDRYEKGIVKDLQSNYGAKREKIKADCILVATAIAKEADCIISNDTGLEKFAEGQIEVRKIPNIGKQANLFQ